MEIDDQFAETRLNTMASAALRIYSAVVGYSPALDDRRLGLMSAVLTSYPAHHQFETRPCDTHLL